MRQYQKLNQYFSRQASIMLQEAHPTGKVGWFFLSHLSPCLTRGTSTSGFIVALWVYRLCSSYVKPLAEPQAEPQADNSLWGSPGPRDRPSGGRSAESAKVCSPTTIGFRNENGMIIRFELLVRSPLPWSPSPLVSIHHVITPFPQFVGFDITLSN